MTEAESALDAGNLAAEDLVALKLKWQGGSIDEEQFIAGWQDVMDRFFTGDKRRDVIRSTFLNVALVDLAAWSWLEGRATAAR